MRGRLAAARILSAGRCLPTVTPSRSQVSSVRTRLSSGFGCGRQTAPLYKVRGFQGARPLAVPPADEPNRTTSSLVQNGRLHCRQAAVSRSSQPKRDALSIGGGLASQTLALSPDTLWWFEKIVNVGSVKMGLPGLAAIGVFLAPIDVMTRILKEADIGKLPLLPYSAMATNGAIWTCYGILLNSPPIWAPNVVGLVCGSIYSAIYVKNCPSGADWLPGTTAHHAMGTAAIVATVVATASFAPHDMACNIIGLMGNTSAVILFAGPLTAVKSIIAEKSTKSLPFAFTLLAFTNCTLWTYYGWFHLNDPYIYFPNALGFGLSVMQLALFARFGIHR